MSWASRSAPVVRRAAPLFGDGTPRATVRKPVHFPDLIRWPCASAADLTGSVPSPPPWSGRPDVIWVDVLGGGEICTILHLDGPDARNKLLVVT
ncbi:hypothetical protein [Streptomyces mirabilis]|uniref:hypothetical protein n=1 Tax=Streptomyces mirabilis TaxID=68239 RepID=UPI001E32DF33|nr:hypothetical protein [Streptomyces mirabilis]